MRPRRIDLRARGISVLDLGGGSGMMGSAELKVQVSEPSPAICSLVYLSVEEGRYTLFMLISPESCRESLLEDRRD